MKRILITILLLLVGLAGCGEKVTPVNVNYNEIDNIKILIDLLPSPVTEDDRDDVMSIKLRYDALTDEEKELVTNLAILNTALEYFRVIDETIEQTNQLFDDLAQYYDEYIPEIVYDNLEFPTTHETELGEVKVMWGTSDHNTITTLGQVIRGRKNINVEITTTFILKDIRASYKQNVIVKNIAFDRLPANRLAVGYVMSSRNFNGLSDVAIQTLDVVNYAFANINNHKVSVLSLANLEKMLDARRHGVRVLLCIGGYGKDAVPFSQAARTEETRIIFAQSIVDAVEKYHFDGVDIDWEYPGFYGDSGYSIPLTEDKANYNLLMAEIRTRLKAANEDYIISAAVPGGGNYPRNYDLAGLNNILDYFNLMTYDLDDRNTSSHVTPLYNSSYSTSASVNQTVNLYKNSGVSPSKLIIGAAFYGRQFNLKSTGRIMMASATSASITYSNIYSFYLSITDGTVTRYWDNTAKAPYLYDSKNNVTISYEDPESIKYKAQYAIDQNLAGMMFWEYSQDSNDTLLTAVYEHLVKNR